MNDDLLFHRRGAGSRGAKQFLSVPLPFPARPESFQEGLHSFLRGFPFVVTRGVL